MARAGRDFEVRPGRPGDHAFVIDSWTRSISGAVPYAWMDREMFSEVRSHVRRMVMGPGSVELLIACDPADDDVIYGWIVGGVMVVGKESSFQTEFAWIRRGMRNRGIGTSLFNGLKALVGANGLSSFFTIHTKDVEAMRLTEKWEMRYRPWKIL